MRLLTDGFLSKFVNEQDFSLAKVIYIPSQKLSHFELESNENFESVCIIDLSNNQLDQNVFKALYNYFPSAWWIELSSNCLESFDKVSIPLALGSLSLCNNPLQLKSFLSSFQNCHILRLSISLHNLGYQSYGDDQEYYLSQEWDALSTIIQQLPNVWVFNDQYISVYEKGIVSSLGTEKPMSSQHRRPSKSPAVSLQQQVNLSNILGGLSVRQGIILQKLQNISSPPAAILDVSSIPSNIKRIHHDDEKLDILLEDYLHQVYIYNYDFVHTVNKNNAVLFAKKIKMLPIFHSVDFLLNIPHRERLDFAVIMIVSLLFPSTPRQILKESLTILLQSYYPVDGIDDLISLPCFVKTALISLIKRITQREKEELDNYHFLRRKKLLRKNILAGPLANEQNGTANPLREDLPIPTFDKSEGYFFLTSVKNYLENDFQFSVQIKDIVSNEDISKSANNFFSELENDILGNIPQCATKWSAYKELPNATTGLHNVSYASWVSFMARHSIFLLNKTPSCPSLLHLPTNITQQNLYFDLLPLLNAGNMTFKDLGLLRGFTEEDSINEHTGSNKERVMDGRTIKNVMHATNLNLTGENKSKGYQSRYSKRLDLAMKILNHQVLPYGIGLPKGGVNRLTWNADKEQGNTTLPRNYLKPWLGESTSVPKVTTLSDENGHSHDIFNPAAEVEGEVTFFMTENLENDSLANPPLNQRILSPPLTKRKKGAAYHPPYKLDDNIEGKNFDFTGEYQSKPSTASGKAGLFGDTIGNELKVNIPELFPPEFRPHSPQLDFHQLLLQEGGIISAFGGVPGKKSAASSPKRRNNSFEWSNMRSHDPNANLLDSISLHSDMEVNGLNASSALTGSSGQDFLDNSATMGKDSSMMKSYLSISIPSIVSGNNGHNKKYNEDNAIAALESTATTVCENQHSETSKLANNIDMESLDEVNDEAPDFKDQNIKVQNENIAPPPKIASVSRKSTISKVNVYTADALWDSHFLVAPSKTVNAFNELYSQSAPLDEYISANMSADMQNYWRDLHNPPVVLLNSNPISVPPKSIPSPTRILLSTGGIQSSNKINSNATLDEMRDRNIQRFVEDGLNDDQKFLGAEQKHDTDNTTKHEISNLSKEALLFKLFRDDEEDELDEQEIQSLQESIGFSDVTDPESFLNSLIEARRKSAMKHQSDHNSAGAEEGILMINNREIVPEQQILSKQVEFERRPTTHSYSSDSSKPNQAQKLGLESLPASFRNINNLTHEQMELLKDMGTFRNMQTLSRFNSHIKGLRFHPNGKILSAQRYSDKNIEESASLNDDDESLTTIQSTDEAIQISKIFKSLLDIERLKPGSLKIQDENSNNFVSSRATNVSPPKSRVHSPSVEAGGIFQMTNVAQQTFEDVNGRRTAVGDDDFTRIRKTASSCSSIPVPTTPVNISSPYPPPLSPTTNTLMNGMGLYSTAKPASTLEADPAISVTLSLREKFNNDNIFTTEEYNKVPNQSDLSYLNSKRKHAIAETFYPVFGKMTYKVQPSLLLATNRVADNSANNYKNSQSYKMVTVKGVGKMKAVVPSSTFDNTTLSEAPSYYKPSIDENENLSKQQNIIESNLTLLKSSSSYFNTLLGNCEEIPYKNEEETVEEAEEFRFQDSSVSGQSLQHPATELSIQIAPILAIPPSAHRIPIPRASTNANTNQTKSKSKRSEQKRIELFSPNNSLSTLDSSDNVKIGLNLKGQSIASACSNSSTASLPSLGKVSLPGNPHRDIDDSVQMQNDASSVMNQSVATIVSNASSINYQLSNEAIYEAYEEQLSLVEKRKNYDNKEESNKRVSSTREVSKSLTALNLVRNGKSHNVNLDEGGAPYHPHQVKPHRRLLSMSATSPAHEHIWVGMDGYRAATHKTNMNRSFRMKLPAISDTSNKQDFL